MSLEQHRAFNRMYQKDKMTLGFLLSFEPMANQLPKMENTVELARKIDLVYKVLIMEEVRIIKTFNHRESSRLNDIWIDTRECYRFFR